VTDAFRFLLLRSGRGRVGLVIVCAFVVMGIFGRWLAPYDPNSIDAEALLQGPSLSHPFGLDQFGRDELSRILTAALPMLRITVASVLAGAITGTALGLCAAFFGGRLDSFIMRALDIVLAFPIIIMGILIIAYFGVGERNVAIALAIAFTPGFARVARAATLTVMHQPYVLAARAIGDSKLAVIWRQILPNIMPVLLVQASLSCAYAILGEAALSFLGLSVQPPAASWGRMLAEGRDFLSTSAHMATVPGFMITVVVIGFNLVGDGLRDYLDPRMREQLL
jgi:peptide/nickel transport system permease protein